MGLGRRWVIVGMIAAGMLIAIAAAGLPLYVFPAHDEPRAVDAVYVIGPPTDTRIAMAESMVEDGLADALVVSLAENEALREWFAPATAACEEDRDYDVYCAQPDPFTTRGEARWIRDLIDEHEWESVAVITYRPHISRTRAIMKRCWDGDFVYLDSGEEPPLGEWIYQYAYQTGGFVKVLLESGC
ncbi:YdcF family protein [Demequina rhizosphaerae]|uniref:YdcF family protein n=1 Tax=Demequina rhizosphaerae TaxID=1638985 RepID=UPI000AB1D8C6|nr:YdcF family protein [Demequina rhizosphaerae]